jgi:probable rRNA maturation factor
MTATIAIAIDCPDWLTVLPDAEAVVRESARAAVRAAAPALGPSAELSVLLTDDDTMRGLNRDYRGKDAPTNVLAFETGDDDSGETHAPVLLGDVVIALGVMQREASEQGKTLADHVRHLVVHGVLHLLGHDHLGEEEAQVMEAAETAILAGLGVADPYAGERQPEAAGAGR